MTETAVIIVIDKLVPLIAEEAKLLSGIHKEVKNIKDELEIIAAFLKEADAREARGETNHLIKAWVKQVIDVSYRMEDVIDEYLHHVALRSEKQQQTPQRHRNRVRFISFLRKISRFIIKLKPRHELASEIQDIKENVRDIKDRGKGYGLFNSTPQGTSSTSGAHNHPPIASLFVDEAELVGIEAPKDLLLSWFAEEQVQRMIFSLVGMGGVGKTTIAKKVFDSQKGRFDCYAWITVSQTYSMKELLKSLIHQFHEACKESVPAGMDNMDEVMLINNLHEYVKQKRYVVAFDDIWNVEFWMAMKHALPENRNCSRIIITTRNAKVAPSSIASSLNRVHLLRPLSFEKAWELFCKKVFQSPNNEACYCPPELEMLSKAMVRRCDGLPLAIVAIGGILSTKQKDVFEWQKLHDSLVTKLENNENLESVIKVLSLSYHALPYHLKPCLLYFGIYPEDCSIRGSRLIRQWIAEGFVKTNGQEIIEDVAEGYLIELVQRNLIQVSEIDYSSKARAYQVHDLIRDFIHSNSKQLRFGQFFTKHDSSNLGDQGRRLSILDNAVQIFDENINFPITPVRSTFLFQILEFPNNFVIKLFENFKLLTMLDFEDCPLTFLPDEVGNLFLLKYLSIRNTKVKCLPKSIGKLQQLETLDMKQSLVHELPEEIRRLCKLRHLLAYRYEENEEFSLSSTKGVTIQGGLGCERTMQKLSCVEADDGILVKELRNFRELRKLGITKVKRTHGMDLCIAIQNMVKLSSLTITAMNENEVIDLQPIVSPPPLLQRLILQGKMEILPNWISKLHNVVRVWLRWSGLTDDPLQALQQLPHLLELEIITDAYIGEQLHFQKGGFKKLKVLSLRNLDALKKLIIDEGALSNLENLDIGPSPLLKEVPSGIQHLTKLKYVYFHNMPREFNKSMAKKGPNYKLIRHIPDVRVAIKSGPRKHSLFPLEWNESISVHC